MGLHFGSMKQVVVKGVADQRGWFLVAPAWTFNGTQKGSCCSWMDGSATQDGYSLPTLAMNSGFPKSATQPSEQINAI